MSLSDFRRTLAVGKSKVILGAGIALPADDVGLAAALTAKLGAAERFAALGVTLAGQRAVVVLSGYREDR